VSVLVLLVAAEESKAQLELRDIVLGTRSKEERLLLSILFEAPKSEDDEVNPRPRRRCCCRVSYTGKGSVSMSGLVSRDVGPDIGRL
jgi:hypothetical protein